MFYLNAFLYLNQQRKQEEDAKKKHETEMDYLAPFLAQIGDPSHLSRSEAYKLKEECLQDLKQRLIDRANLIQARFEKVRHFAWFNLNLTVHVDAWPNFLQPPVIVYTGTEYLRPVSNFALLMRRNLM